MSPTHPYSCPRRARKLEGQGTGRVATRAQEGGCARDPEPTPFWPIPRECVLRAVGGWGEPRGCGFRRKWGLARNNALGAGAVGSREPRLCSGSKSECWREGRRRRQGHTCPRTEQLPKQRPGPPPQQRMRDGWSVREGLEGQTRTVLCIQGLVISVKYL